VGCMKLQRGVVRPLKTAGDRLGGARTGAHQAHDALPRPPRGRFRNRLTPCRTRTWFLPYLTARAADLPTAV
jgi:hypothetical protein